MYYWTIVGTSGTLILAFGWLRLQIVRNKVESEFAKILTTCLLVFNLAVLTHFYMAYYTDTDRDAHYGAVTSTITDVMECIDLAAVIVSVCAFNLGEWYQGIHYYKCATEMEMLLTRAST